MLRLRHKAREKNSWVRHLTRLYSMAYEWFQDWPLDPEEKAPGRRAVPGALVEYNKEGCQVCAEPPVIRLLWSSRLRVSSVWMRLNSAANDSASSAGNPASRSKRTMRR